MAKKQNQDEMAAAQAKGAPGANEEPWEAWQVQELRLECLRLACGKSNHAEPFRLAERYVEFVLTGSPVGSGRAE